MKLKAKFKFHMSFQRCILRIHWFHHVTNVEVTGQTDREDLTSHICRWRAAVFGHVRRLPEEAPGRMDMRLAVNMRAGGRPDNNPHWKRSPRHTWVRQVEFDTGTSDDVAWGIAVDRALRPQLVKWDWWWWRWSLEQIWSPLLEICSCPAENCNFLSSLLF